MVHPAYGVGRVTARRSAVVQGVERDVVVIELADNLTVELPVERATGLLRRLASEADIDRVGKTLRGEGVVGTEPWLARQRAVRAKLAAGDLLGLAEVVRDGAARQRSLRAKTANAQLSPGERETVVRARHLLSAEIAQARGVAAVDAEHWIEEQLERR